MKGIMDVFKMAVGDVRVDLRGCDRCMAQKRLHRAQIRAVHEQVRCVGMPQGVRRDVFGDAGELGVA